MYDKNKLINTVVKLLNEKKIGTDKIHMQKFISFLADNDQNIPFNFSVYKYGPFSKDLSSTLNIMCGWGYIKYDDKYIFKKGESLEEDEKNKLSALVDKFNNVLPKHSFEENFDILELYSTLYYYMKRVENANKEVVFEKFIDAKAEKFSEEQVIEAYESLLRLFCPRL